MKKLLLALALLLPAASCMSGVANEREITDVKWSICSGSPEDFMIVREAYVYGQVAKGATFTVRVVGKYLQEALIETAKCTVKYGFLTVMDEEIYRPTVCTKDRQFDISKSALFPLEPLDGGYKVTFRYFNEIGIEKGCWLINFKIK